MVKNEKRQTDKKMIIIVVYLYIFEFNVTIF